MARLYADVGYDMDNFNLHRLVASEVSADFYNNQPVTLNGITYQDAYEVVWDNGNASTAFAGSSIRHSSSTGVITGGTVTGIFEAYYSDAWQLSWSVQGISVSATALYRAAQTSSTADDDAILRSALSENDVIRLSSESDRARGYDGADKLSGAGGNDLLHGEDGRDSVLGGTGSDFLRGGSGDDKLLGGAGNDRLEGDVGNDVLWGNGGADTFRFEAGRDRIQDFQNNSDTLAFDDALWGGGAETASQILSYAHMEGTAAVFDFGGGHVLTVEGVTSLNLLSDDVSWF